MFINLKLSTIKRSIENKLNLKDKNYIKKHSLGFITSMLACASIPYSKPKENFFKRNNGYCTLKIISDPEYGLPYGLLPRIIIIWLCTEVKLKHSPLIYLGKTQNEFIKKLGMNSTGGVNGTVTRIKDQINRLFHSNISLIYNRKNSYKYNNLSIIDNSVFLKKKINNKKYVWKRKILLSKKFFNIVNSSSLPIDLKVIKSIRSPLAIDIYIWLTWRNKIIKKRNTKITWNKLRLQFGSSYCDSPKGLSNFKIGFIKRLKNVYSFYSKLRIQIFKDYLKLKRSRPHVSPVVNR